MIYILDMRAKTLMNVLRDAYWPEGCEKQYLTETSLSYYFRQPHVPSDHGFL